MSRPIKFRVWDKKYKMFSEYGEGKSVGSTVYFENLLLHGKGFLCLVGDGGVRAANDDDFVVQQFTGLLDKNGREIYEGDIYNLSSYGGNPYYCVWHDGIYWNKKAGQTDQQWLSDFVNVHHSSRHDLRGHCKRAEVIGNIFENPELVGLTTVAR